MTRHALSEVYYEFIQVHGMIKVCAVDAATGVEVAIVASADESQQVLERTALAKLRYVLEKKQKSPPPASTGTGILA